MSSANSPVTLKVLMMPDYRIDNPYQTLLSQALESQGVKVMFPIGYRRVFPILRAILDQSEPVDVFHLHWLETYLKGGKNIIIHCLYAVKLLIDILLVRLLGIKVVWTIHDYLEHETPYPGLELWSRKILVKLTNRLIVHNQSFLETVSHQYGLKKNKISHVSHGHYRSVYGYLIDKAEARNKLNLPVDKFIYLNLGMIRPYKGIEHLLRVWQTNQNSFGDSLLLIAGKPLSQEYGQKITEQINQVKNVLFYDHFIANEDIHLFFSAADIVVLPFQNLLTSGSAILAMSFGKPIIAPKIGSLPELLSQSNALLYDPEDQKGLELAFYRSRDSDLQKLSKSVVKDCDDLDWAKIGFNTAEVYKQCFLNP